VFHVLRSTYLQSPDVVEQTRPAHLVTGDLSEEDVQDLVDRDPYTPAGAARYERTSFNGAFRAPGL
jgi:hypothetical protein